MFRSLPLAARAYVAAVLAIGAVVFAWGVPVDTVTRPGLLVSLALVGALAGAFRIRLPVPGLGSSLSLSAMVHFSSIALVGADAAMLVAAASGWTQSTLGAKRAVPAHRTLFNILALVVTVRGAGIVYGLLGGGAPGAGWTTTVGAFFGSATAYFALNTGLVAAASALATRRPVLTVWRAHYLWSAPGCYVSAALAATPVPLIHLTGPWPLLLAALPLWMTHRVYEMYIRRLGEGERRVRELSDLHISTVEALARAIDAKDQQSHVHLRRVQVFASELARATGLSEFEVHGVRTAALLHDVGQLAVPEHILAKPGPLTREEFEKVRTHPEVGAAILADVPFPYPVASLILGHHERWDGQGYPAGLKAEAIPLGARILSVVDYYDALTSDRPYHRAMPHEAAVRLLQQEAGHALDPVLVAQFIEMLPRLRAEIAARSPESEAAPRPAGNPGRSVFDDIALAHREIYTLYEIAHAMGTSLNVSETMELVASKLTRLVPFSCCALFLLDEDSGQLHCRFSSGVDADVVHRLVAGDNGAAGHVARHGQAMVNASPRADLDAAGLTSVATRLLSALLCPLVCHDRVIGTLALYDVQPRRYNENHRRLLMRVAEQVGAVIYNSVLFEQTRQDALTDALTGLPNVRFLYMHVARELARAVRLDSPVALIVMDVDDFKQINDTYGHHVGDLALKEAGRLIRDAIRPYDLCARYAGDEFILVLTACSAEEAESKLVELQAAIEDLPIAIPPLRLGVSGGIAVFPEDGRSYESLLALADGRMYRNKALRKGRAAHRPHEAPEVGSPDRDGLPGRPKGHPAGIA